MFVNFSLISRFLWTTVLMSLLAVVNVSQAAQNCDPETEATTPSSRFTVNADQTVLDKETQLVWKQCPQGLRGESCRYGEITAHTWKDALTIAEQENFAGKTDWRLPNLEELLSIVEHQCSNPAVNLAVFPLEQNWFFWSSDPYPANTDVNKFAYALTYSNASTAWGVDTYSVKRSKTKQDTSVHGAVRLVRTAPDL